MASAILLIACAAAEAATVEFKDGNRLEVDIIEQTEESLVIEFNGVIQNLEMQSIQSVTSEGKVTYQADRESVPSEGKKILRHTVSKVVDGKVTVTERNAYSSGSWGDGARDYEKARKKQENSHAPMLLYFYTDWCPYCKKFDNGLLADSRVKKALKNVIKVRINPEKDDASKQLAGEYGVSGYPTVLLIKNPGERPKKMNTGTNARRFVSELK